MKKKLLIAGVISVVPIGALRRFLYRSLMGYQIDASARIGIMTVIAVESCVIGAKVRIGPFNLFKGPIKLSIGDASRIGRFNEFTSNWKLGQERFEHMRYDPVLQIGKGCLILHQHYFDVYGRMILGDGSWVAGIRSQFWTHGVSAMDRDIVIGTDNYIATSTRFAPGSGIGNGNIVGIASVVTSMIDADDSIIAGYPAKAIRSIKEQKAEGKYRFSFEDWAD